MLIEKELFVTIAKFIATHSNVSKNMLNEDFSEYVLHDLRMNCLRQNGKVIPESITFPVFGSSYTLDKMGNISLDNAINTDSDYLSMDSIENDYEEAKDDHPDDDDYFDKYYDEETAFDDLGLEDDILYINDDDFTMKIINSYLKWRVQILEKLNV